VISVDEGEADMRKLRKILVGVLDRTLVCTVFLPATFGYTIPNVRSFAQTIAALPSLAKGNPVASVWPNTSCQP
jgi:hypothetical protein